MQCVFSKCYHLFTRIFFDEFAQLLFAVCQLVANLFFFNTRSNTTLHSNKKYLKNKNLVEK